MSREGFGPPKSGRYDYPCWETRTQDNIDQLKRAERFLADYWEMYDHEYYAACGISVHTYEPEVFKCRPVMQQDEPKKKHKPTDSGIELDDIDVALSQLDQPKESDGVARNLTTEADLLADGMMPMQDFLAVKPTNFTFTERSLRIFRKMFSTPSQSLQEISDGPIS